MRERDRRTDLEGLRRRHVSRHSGFSRSVVHCDEALPLPHGERGGGVEAEALGLDLAVCFFVDDFLFLERGRVFFQSVSNPEIWKES